MNSVITDARLSSGQFDPGGHLEMKSPTQDLRQIQNGHIIPSFYYADQPYLVDTADGAWLCVLTTGYGDEGESGQHIVSMRSMDRGKTWQEVIPIEPKNGPEASWAVPLRIPSGRIFVFYVYNTENIRELPADQAAFKNGKTHRMDSHGDYVFRWSDDHGKSWSSERIKIPVREFEIDRTNSTGGAVRLFWNVGRPQIIDSSVFIPLHKVKGFGVGWFTHSEGAFVRTDDLISLQNPSRATWVTLPEGDHGLKAPEWGGDIAEEQSLVSLSDGSLFCSYRTVAGYVAGSYSRDQGKTWETPHFLHYQDGGLVKHPRAACFTWKLSSGGYLLWYHNHGGEFISNHPQRGEIAYADRNPAWISPGIEKLTERGLELVWGNPEVVLYDDDPYIRISYPDLKEEGDEIYITETQKKVARIHCFSERLTLALRHGEKSFNAEEIIVESFVNYHGTGKPHTLKAPEWPLFLSKSKECPFGLNDLRGGLSIELELNPHLSRTGTLFSCWESSLGGLWVGWKENGILSIKLSDGRSEFSWDCEHFRSQGISNHIVIIVDGGPKIISYIVDGKRMDGGSERQFGWGRFTPYF
ncbi:MAG: sialidase family protein, partial [Verrucomicrobiota bacterium]